VCRASEHAGHDEREQAMRHSGVVQAGAATSPASN
jgi:hypothetical protein